MRDASDLIQARSGSRPAIFLANLGRPAGFTTRAAFARNLFEAGGIAAPSNDGFAAEARTDLAAMVKAFAPRTGLACLCASDEVYARDGGAAAKALAAAGARHIYLRRPAW